MMLRLRTIAAVCAVALLPSAAAAAPAPAPSPSPTPGTAAANEPWWVPVGLRGQTVTDVSSASGQLTVVANGRRLVSADGGRSFVSAPGAEAPSSVPAGLDAAVRSGDDLWALRGGRVLHARGSTSPALDPGSPDLGAGARLLTAPAELPGYVVAVSDGGVVWWRNGASSTWTRALVLLPQTLFSGRPRITALTAFDRPLTTAIYLATDGYSVLLSTKGGEEWIRAGPGLPDSVQALSSDSAAQAVYAGTADGLWVHHLRAQPAVPVYTGPDLLNRRLGTAAITLVAIAAGVALLGAGLRRRPTEA